MRVRSYGLLEMRAYHEAGHVLVAILEGFRVKRVTITRRGRLGGLCEYGVLVPRRASGRALRRIVDATAAVAVAGSAAQDREALARGLVALDPRSGAPLPLFGAGAEDDARIATRFARRLHPRAAARRAFLGRVRTRVELVLDDPTAWAAVRRLAGALLRVRTLSGDEARRTTRRAIADAVRRDPPPGVIRPRRAGLGGGDARSPGGAACDRAPARESTAAAAPSDRARRRRPP